jgi:hypothetical protein
MSDADALSAAWQVALGAEQQAAFGYALLGPHLPDDQQTRARSLQAVHEQLRDSTAGSIAAGGTTPTAPQGDYPDLYGVAPLVLAARLEDDCAVAWRYLYATAAQTAHNAGPRTLAQRHLTASAVRATRWRVLAGSPRAVTAFPGTAQK